MMIAWFMILIAVSLITSYCMASLFWGKGAIPDCFNIGNWTVGTGIVFVFIESIFGFFIYLQASGQMPTLLDVLGVS
ncbi:hypothetical protein ACE3I0_23115 [Enterobacter hormaechei subsp. hoffmannii]|jgi:hypothetical protein|uniref:hypothetical protein n=1 Tax=Klebsiella pneumoniae TaxID=573 RepID=UPI0028608A1F|nr:hypothetical protein [Salmonella enterica]